MCGVCVYMQLILTETAPGQDLWTMDGLMEGSRAGLVQREAIGSLCSLVSASAGKKRMSIKFREVLVTKQIERNCFSSTYTVGKLPTTTIKQTI